MTSRAESGIYTGATTDTVLVSCPATARLVLNGVIFTAASGNTGTPSMTIKHGTNVIIVHPGVTAGGGLTVTGLECLGGAGEDITFSCTDPGGSCAATVLYSWFS